MDFPWHELGQYGALGLVCAFLGFFLWNVVTVQFPAIVNAFKAEMAIEREIHDKQLTAERLLYANVLETMRGVSEERYLAILGALKRIEARNVKPNKPT